MVVNSVKKYLDEATAVSEIRLLLKAPTHIKKTFVVVEGEDDYKFFKKILSNEVEIVIPHNSKDGVRNIVEKHFTNMKNVLGIRDRDYETQVLNPKIFFCDYCCAEMMIIANDESMRSLYSEHYKGALDYILLRNKILQRIKFLSLCRKYNEEHSCGINFQGIHATHYNDNIDANIHQKVISTLNTQNPKNNLNSNMIKYAYSEYVKDIDLLTITNGHDFINLFTLFCNDGKNKDTSVRTISSSLRCSFGTVAFKSTNLYLELNNYQASMDLKIVD